MEKMSRKNEKLIEFLKIAVAVGGLTAAVACPILPYAAYPFYKLYNGRSERKEIERIRNALSKRGLISVEEDGRIRVTEKGNLFLNFERLDNLIIKIVKDWDGKWRIVIFDIPEEKKFAREYFRKFLRGSGFISFQESVFIYPYPCEKEIREAAEILGIWDYVNIIRADKIDKEEKFRELFGLK